MARPKKNPDEIKHKRFIYMDDDTIDKAKVIASHRKVSFSQLMTLMVLEATEEHSYLFNEESNKNEAA